ncbi:hypothetical protein [Mesonia sp. K7]|uniref:hypothetical protein n=1 Tax=Mesonia sp. K7 TaxID=2218606 RepID=UPI000DA96716|nr:hypothetical protein [Mesonia sp. K7]PZD78650.1 hypothetical protein DNG35_04125 [Mesonia sp. K7]
MKKIILSSLTLLIAFAMTAQKGKVLEGDWKSLKGIEKFDLEFDYSNVEVPDFDTEEDYINQKMKEKDEDEPGQGKVWKEKYFADREAHFEPKFIESFNKRESQKVSKTYDGEPYILRVETTMIYNGWNVGVMRKPARIDAIIYIYKRGENSPLLKVKYENVKGADAMGYDFASHSRVAEAYAKLAKSFMKDFKKKV